MTASSDNWCKHYRAMSTNATCEIGISYDSVRGDRSALIGLPYPCVSREVYTCNKALYPTADEIAAHDAEIAKILAAFQSNLDNDICPHCKTPIQQWNQVGRCVYAAPCGCRLYQGKVPKGKQAKGAKE